MSYGPDGKPPALLSASACKGNHLLALATPRLAPSAIGHVSWCNKRAVAGRNLAALHPANPIKCRTNTQKTTGAESVDTRKSLPALDPLENSIGKKRIFHEQINRSRAVQFSMFEDDIDRGS